jgi:hypothetical protein
VRDRPISLGNLRYTYLKKTTIQSQCCQLIVSFLGQVNQIKLVTTGEGIVPGTVRYRPVSLGNLIGKKNLVWLRVANSVLAFSGCNKRTLLTLGGDIVLGTLRDRPISLGNLIDKKKTTIKTSSAACFIHR